ncbi:hypothetical protein HYX06_03630 [Candidatus Woesearchaeota archaeon]|nr:hypothetical protein [Candidatus Woesearchaeota archaeon]
MDKTQADKILRNSSVIKLNKSLVKVPKLTAIKRKKSNIKKTLSKKNEGDIPTSALINILIKNAVENEKNNKKEKKIISEEGKAYALIKDENAQSIGGYGTIPKSYGISANSSYIDYEKLFSYLGKFRAKSPYQSLNNSNPQNNGDDGFALASGEIMDKAARHIKYLRSSSREFGVGAGGIDAMSMVPMGDMSAAEWAEFKLWFQLDKVAYYLKRKIA